MIVIFIPSFNFDGFYKFFLKKYLIDLFIFVILVKCPESRRRSEKLLADAR